LAALYPNRGACPLIDSPRFIFPSFVKLVYRRCQITFRECFQVKRLYNFRSRCSLYGGGGELQFSL